MTIREVSLRTLCRFDQDGSFVRDTLDEALRRESFDERDRAFATELVYGVLRWRGRLDWTLEQLIPKGLDALTPWIRNTLRMGVYQLLMMTQVPDAAATHEAVQLAKRFGHSGTVGLTNAVLRNVIRKRESLREPPRFSDPIKEMSVRYSYPPWLVERWLARYGTETARKLFEWGNHPPPVVIRTNRLKTTPEALASLLKQGGIDARPGLYLTDFLILRDAGAVPNLPGYPNGLFQVQDESAGIAIRLLAPQPGETIVDLCCAPGGKTLYIADLMQDRGRVLGADIAPDRLIRLRDHCRRMVLHSVKPLVMDGRSPGLKVQADRVLVDAPCTGLGTIARRAELRWRRKPEDILAAQKLQNVLIEQGARLVRPGGTLVYSTCSIEPEENEGVVRAFCERHPEFRIERPEEWPSALDGLLGEDHMIRTLPSTHGIDGSFSVRMKRETVGV